MQPLVVAVAVAVVGVAVAVVDNSLCDCNVAASVAAVFVELGAEQKHELVADAVVVVADAVVAVVVAFVVVVVAVELHSTPHLLF